MKELIDYFNEKYTKKEEYICKDLKPIKLLNSDEYRNLMNDAGLINPQEIRYYPLFKISKIKDNRPAFISYILKTDDEKYKGSMMQVKRNGYKLNAYSNPYVRMAINRDEVALDTNDIFINGNNCSLTLYTGSPKLPKLEYPKNKMDMYRALNFIETVCNSVYDRNLYELFNKVIKDIPLPNNIDEIDLHLENPLFCNIFDIRNNAYFVNPDKDNYYTILDAIKKGKIIYRNLETPLVNWSINNEEKWIKFNRNIAIVNETSWVDLEK